MKPAVTRSITAVLSAPMPLMGRSQSPERGHRKTSRETHGDCALAAEILGIDKSTRWRKVKRYNIKEQGRRPGSCSATGSRLETGLTSTGAARFRFAVGGHAVTADEQTQTGRAHVKRMRSRVPRLAAMLLATGLGLGLPASAQQATESSLKLGPDDMVLRGDAKCTGCHQDSDSPRPTMLGERPWILSIGKTKHGTAADGRTPTCTTCHGESDAHREEGEAPDRVFKKTTSAETQNQACTACHKGGTHMFWTGSVHETRGVACASCHTIHAGHDKVRDKLTQSEVCLSCHKEQRAQIHRPSRHPIKEGKVACSDCHDAHGTLTPKLLVRDNVNNTCYQCHMEKRGPFVRTHQPVQEDCTICHNPHGTVNANLLKHRPPFLCQQCHEPSHTAMAHQGRPGSLTGTGFSANSMARGCLNCHTNIHGSNNPSDVGSQRSLRR